MRALLAIWVSDINLFKFIMKIHSWAGDGEKEGEGALHNGPVSGDYFGGHAAIHRTELVSQLLNLTSLTCHDRWGSQFFEA